MKRYEVITSEGRIVDVVKSVFDQFPASHKRVVDKSAPATRPWSITPQPGGIGLMVSVDTTRLAFTKGYFLLDPREYGYEAAVDATAG